MNRHEHMHRTEIQAIIRRLERAAVIAFRLGDLAGAFQSQNEANNARIALAQMAKDDFASRFIESYRELARREQPKEVCEVAS